MTELQLQRRFYAEEIRAVSGIDSDAVVDAFASVPREHFLGPGPWRVVAGDGLGVRAPYRTTRDDSATHLYHNVAVAIDAARLLNNGQPSALALWIAALDVHPGDRVLHVGCGVGYYTAILAHLTGPSGHVTGVEVDADLAERARANLADWPWTSVVHGDGTPAPGPLDGILVNAGCTFPRAAWLDDLADGGRLVIPITAHVPAMPHGAGAMLRIARRDDGLSAEMVSPVMIYDCDGARDPEDNGAILGFLRAGAGAAVRRLRRDEHPRGDACLLHTGRYCLTR